MQPEVHQINADGMSGQFIGDLLSAFLMHERCGAELYEAVAGKTKNPILKAKYQEFGRETERHVQILMEVIAAGGGSASYVSPMARCVEAQDKALVHATLSANPPDLMTQEMAMLDAVFVAEAVDHANWQALSKLAEQLKDHGVGPALQRAVREVEPQEDKHLFWASETRSKLTLLQARSSVVGAVGERAEEMIARIQDWLKA